MSNLSIEAIEPIRARIDQRFTVRVERAEDDKGVDLTVLFDAPDGRTLGVKAVFYDGEWGAKSLTETHLKTCARILNDAFYRPLGEPDSWTRANG
jgi:hypothetical protein